jgi:hypothetical protein
MSLPERLARANFQTDTFSRLATFAANGNEDAYGIQAPKAARHAPI